MMVIGLICKIAPWLPAVSIHPAQTEVLPHEGPAVMVSMCVQTADIKVQGLRVDWPP